ncbi:hypothetical protein CRYUN_Cryun01aG0234900 [Craigia yunnanensis]
MTAQKGMLPKKPWKNGVVTIVAFVVFGTAPLLSFIILKPFTDDDLVMLIGACFMSALALALLGIARAKIAGKNYWYSQGQDCWQKLATVSRHCRAFAAAAAYFLGWMLKNVAGLEEPTMTKVEQN